MNITNFPYFKIIMIVIVCACIACAFFGYQYVQSLKKDMQVMQANNTAIQTALKQSNKTIQDMQTSFKDVQRFNKELQVQINTRNDELKELNASIQKLENASIKNAVAKHPKLVEKAVNNASDKAIQCFEDISEDLICE